MCIRDRDSGQQMGIGVTNADPGQSVGINEAKHLVVRGHRGLRQRLQRIEYGPPVLQTAQRDFANPFPPTRGLSPDTRGTPVANGESGDMVVTSLYRDDIYPLIRFNTHDVKKFDRNGNLLGNAFPARASGIAGPEIGTTFGPDGNLYVPGWISNSVIRYDPRTGDTAQVIAPRQSGISQPRGLLNDKDGIHMYLMTEGSSQLFRWNPATGALTELRRNLSGPTMLTYAANGELLIAVDDGVTRLDPETGATLGVLVAANSGGLAGATFLALIPKPVTLPAPLSNYFEAKSTIVTIPSTADPGTPLELEAADPGAWGNGIHVQVFHTSAASAAVQAIVTNVVANDTVPVSYTHLRAHETVLDLVCRLLLEKKKHDPTIPVLTPIPPL